MNEHPYGRGASTSDWYITIPINIHSRHNLECYSWCFCCYVRCATFIFRAREMVYKKKQVQRITIYVQDFETRVVQFKSWLAVIMHFIFICIEIPNDVLSFKLSRLKFWLTLTNRYFYHRYIILPLNFQQYRITIIEKRPFLSSQWMYQNIINILKASHF